MLSKRNGELISTNGQYLYSGHTYKVESQCAVKDLFFSDLLMTAIASLTSQDRITELRYLKYHGTKFCKDRVILTYCHPRHLPTFGTVYGIFMHRNEFFIVFLQLDTVKFERTLNAYEVKPLEDDAGVVCVSKLPFPHPLMRIKCGGSYYVLLLNHSRVEYGLEGV
jgi:hypothetical protein